MELGFFRENWSLQKGINFGRINGEPTGIDGITHKLDFVTGKIAL